MSMKKRFKDIFRDRFYDKVVIGGSFTFYENGYVGDIYHITSLTKDQVTYRLSWKGYWLCGDKTVTRSAFKSLVSGGKYNGVDYLFNLL